jgi:hypothetical protein
LHPRKIKVLRKAFARCRSRANPWTKARESSWL